LVDELTATVKKSLTALLGGVAGAHPTLLQKLVTASHAIVDEERDKALTLVLEKVDAEMTSPFTVNEEYDRLLAECDALIDTEGPLRPDALADSDHRLFPTSFVRAASEDIKGGTAEAVMTRRLQISLHAYQHVLQARLFDCIPMDVRFRVMFKLQARLAPTLLRDETDLLPLISEEQPEVAARRAALGDELSALRAAAKLLEKTPSASPTAGRAVAEATLHAALV